MSIPTLQHNVTFLLFFLGIIIFLFELTKKIACAIERAIEWMDSEFGLKAFSFRISFMIVHRFFSNKNFS
jgi:hypothetical protein